MDQQIITLGGGCFWCVEAVFELVDGVLAVESGYCNGHVPQPSYEAVCTGTTGHVEVVRVSFDAESISLREVLEIFFVVHDPTTLNRQGNDIGTQYRSAIFYTTDDQRRTAEAVKARVDAGGKWPRPVVTQIVAAGAFTSAEDYHQDYLVKNPGGYSCHFMRG